MAELCGASHSTRTSCCYVHPHCVSGPQTLKCCVVQTICLCCGVGAGVGAGAAVGDGVGVGVGVG